MNVLYTIFNQLFVLFLILIWKNLKLSLNQIFLSCLYKQSIEEMQVQFSIPIQRADGKKVRLQIKQKNLNGKKRKVKTWSAQQDNQLIELYQKYPKRWANIASQMIDRNQNQCLHRYRRLSQLGANRKIWSAEEDQTIRKIIKKVGKNWKLLSQMIGTKTGKQIRERFINKLDPKIKKQEWTDEEDRKIIELFSEIGSKWSQISKKIPGRPQNKIKNRFYSYIQKNYDIKYRPIQQEQKQKRCQFKDITNSMNELAKNHYQKSQMRISEMDCDMQRQNQNHVHHHHQNNQMFKNNGIPSIRQIQFEVKQEYDPSGQNQNGIISNSKIYLRSLVNMDEEWMGFKCTKSIADFNNQNQFMNHDFFYLSNQ